ncbi:MAG: hypothetical protein RMJ19_05725, partial [Gemmatales bacterium]|nr:hypothetical protein [Gemmatales bacterium]MDW8175151.1 hypothetical protein [Gemmatales bacterium]
MLTRYQVALVFGSALFFAILAVAQQGNVQEKPVKLTALAMLEAPREGCDKRYINMAISPDGQKVYAVAQLIHENPGKGPTPAGIVECWNWTQSKAKPVWSLELSKLVGGVGPTRPQILALSPDGKHLALADFDHVKILEAATGKHVRDLAIAVPDGYTNRTVRAVAFSADGRWLAGACADHLMVWDLLRDTLQPYQVCRVRGRGINFLALVRFVSDGEVAALPSPAPSVSFWDVKTGRCLRT